MKKLVLVLSTCLALCLWTTSSFAQDEPDPGDGGSSGGGGAASSSTSTTTTLGILITVSPFIITTSTTAGAASAVSSMEAYMRHNAVALQQDINMGGGQTVDDLAHFFLVEEGNHAAFGKLLRAHRGELLELTRVEALDMERAARFVETIYGAMKAEARFAPSVAQIEKARRG